MNSEQIANSAPDEGYDFLKEIAYQFAVNNELLLERLIPLWEANSNMDKEQMERNKTIHDLDLEIMKLRKENEELVLKLNKWQTKFLDDPKEKTKDSKDANLPNSK